MEKTQPAKTCGIMGTYAWNCVNNIDQGNLISFITVLQLYNKMQSSHFKYAYILTFTLNRGSAFKLVLF